MYTPSYQMTVRRLGSPPCVPLRPSRCKCAGLATFSTMMEAQRDGLVAHVTAYNWSGPRSSPCCEHSALAERKHSMGIDIDATEHNICVTATDPAHRASAAPIRNRQCTVHGFGFWETFSTVTEAPHFPILAQAPKNGIDWTTHPAKSDFRSS